MLYIKLMVLIKQKDKEESQHSTPKTHQIIKRALEKVGKKETTE